eukprot:TRINITY_DN16424_c0_g2_i1.p1 TRINITY_DN16424_c0_g2~~TRINITY_DN16424_c0_g2_i1.p1  ORF type:complete len:425 (+),score=89.90 TRINITY_DN16424_c0_g2_i1:68-1276(+)
MRHAVAWLHSCVVQLAWQLTCSKEVAEPESKGSNADVGAGGGFCDTKDEKYVRECAAISSPQLCEQQSIVCRWARAPQAEVTQPGGDAGLSPCGEAFEEKKSLFLDLSGAWMRVKKPDHLPKSYWEEYVVADKLSRAYSTEDDAWLDKLYASAHEQILICWAKGGRYWDAKLDFGANMQGIRETEKSEVEDTSQWLSRFLSSSLCAPDICTQAQVEREVAPRVFEFKVQQEGSNFVAPSTGAEALEVSHWADIPLDFIIVGVDNCGSTSLRRNLAQHPSVAFTDFSVHGIDEDFVFHDIGLRTLPLRSQADIFIKAKENNPEKVLGSYNPLLWNEGTVETMLQLIPNLRVIMAVCDPVDRLEKMAYLRMENKDSASPDEVTRLAASWHHPEVSHSQCKSHLV